LGERTDVSGTLSCLPWRNYVVSLRYDSNAVDLPIGGVFARLSTVATQVAFSSTLFWVSLLQSDNLSEEVGINTRLQWIPRAGQEGFIVLNYNLEDRDQNNSFHSATSDLSVKFKYTFRF